MTDVVYPPLAELAPQLEAGRDGKYVPVAETIRGFKEIVEGKHDGLPEQAFYMVGTIDEVVESAKKMAAV